MTPLTLSQQNKRMQLFAPTNAAFVAANIGVENVGDFPEMILQNLLYYHMLPGAVDRAAIGTEDALFTSLGVELATSGGTLIDSEGNAIEIVESDVACSNGYLHYVDGVLMPPDLMSSLESYNDVGGSYEGVFDTFLKGLELTNMSGDYKGMNGPFTVSWCFFCCFCYLTVLIWRQTGQVGSRCTIVRYLRNTQKKQKTEIHTHAHIRRVDSCFLFISLVHAGVCPPTPPEADEDAN